MACGWRDDPLGCGEEGPGVENFDVNRLAVFSKMNHNVTHFLGVII